MRARGACAAALLAFGCAGVEEGQLARLAQVVAEPQVGDAQGDVWALLYAPGQGFPHAPAIPFQATAASATRVATGDTHAVFAAVPPNPYRLWAFLDVDGNFDPRIDVLGQPGAGDRVGPGVEINVQPGKRQEFGLAIDTPTADEPPGFRLEAAVDDVVLSEVQGAPTVVTLVSESFAGTLDPRHTGFRVGLVDDDGNGVPDDLDGDGTPDLWPRAFMRWRPRPGQADPDTEVLLPMIFNPAPFLADLGTGPGRSTVVDRIQFAVLGQAQEVKTNAQGKTETSFRAAAPTGEYQLVLYTRTGQYWRIPNDLAGQFASQRVRFHVDRNSR